MSDKHRLFLETASASKDKDNGRTVKGRNGRTLFRRGYDPSPLFIGDQEYSFEEMRAAKNPYYESGVPNPALVAEKEEQIDTRSSAPKQTLADVAAQDRHTDALTHPLNLTETALTALKDQLSVCENDLKQACDDVAAKEQFILTLSKRVDNITKEKEDAEKRVADMTVLLTEMKATNTEHTAHIDALTHQLSVYEDHLRHSQLDITSKDQHIDALTHQLNQTETALTALKDQLSLCENNLKQARDDNILKDAEIARLREEIDNRDNVLRGIELWLNEVKAHDLTNMKIAMQAEIESKNAEIARLRTILCAVDTWLVDLKQKHIAELKHALTAAAIEYKRERKRNKKKNMKTKREQTNTQLLVDTPLKLVYIHQQYLNSSHKSFLTQRLIHNVLTIYTAMLPALIKLLKQRQSSLH
jgi:chromosome segregation ATPase